jgi:hypothetical protein
VVVIGGCGHEDVREWSMGLGWCCRLIIILGEGDGCVIVVVGE